MEHSSVGVIGFGPSNPLGGIVSHFLAITNPNFSGNFANFEKIPPVHGVVLEKKCAIWIPRKQNDKT